MKNSGFTLIELLLSIAIIGTLAIVLIPQLFKARQQAADVQASTYLQQMAQGQTLYRIDNAEYTNDYSQLEAYIENEKSENVTVAIASADANNFCMTATAENGSSKVYIITLAGITWLYSGGCP